MVPLEEQMFAFMVSIGAGCLAAFCFDVYKALARFLRLKKIVLGVGDIVFWVMLAGLVFTLLLLSNGGQMRGFMLIGLALGVGVYIRVLGVHTPRAINSVFELIHKTVIVLKKVLAGAWIILTTPIKFACIVIAWPFKITALVTQKTVKFVSRLFSRLVPADIKRAGKKLTSPLRFLKARLNRKKD